MDVQVSIGLLGPSSDKTDASLSFSRFKDSPTSEKRSWYMGIATNFHRKAGSFPEAVPVLAWVDVVVCLESESHDHLVANLRNE